MKVRNPTYEVSLPKKLNLNLNLVKPLAPTTDLQEDRKTVKWYRGVESTGSRLWGSPWDINFFFFKTNFEEQKKRKEGRKLKLIVMFGFYLGPDFNK